MISIMQDPTIDISVDGHVHTKLCHHACGEMEDYVLSAISRGLRKLVFLEHLEVGINYFEATWLDENDFACYHEEGKRLQVKYRDRLEIGLGVEVGYNPEHTEEIKRRLALHQWDRIGISYHFLDTGSAHLNLVSTRQRNIQALDQIGLDNVVRQYYENLQEAVEKLDGQVLCHIDAVLRHHPDIAAVSGHEKYIDELLDAVAGRKMALEINTSGYRIKNEPYPNQDIIKKALVRNIPLVAGSDAHRPEDVARDFEKLPGLIKRIGNRKN